MNIKFYLPALLILGLLSSCSDHIYGPALHHSDIAYMPKPMSMDSAKSATYISGALVLDFSPNLNDQLTSGQVNISHANTFKNFNLAYGAFTSLGNYANSDLQPNDPFYFKNKFFGAVGGRLSGNFFINSDSRTDFRIIGFEAVYSHEFGDYANFRKAVTGQPNFYTDTRTNLFTGGLTSEIVFHGRKPDTQMGFRVFVGETFGNDNIYNNSNNNYVTYKTPTYVAFSYFVQFKQYFAVVEGGTYVQFRVGLKF
ncbi:hypothetical protein [Mucilaginibacter sp.]|uniref:hypothetical protein n=1 Tax=Mucilaginibacter sp. TaxID=1882438 RepID=UPI0025D8787A|nr:hypothetical protein [Mucilaginibacter sp.]